MWQHWFVWALFLFNAYFFAVALSNVAYFRFATRAPRVKTGPFVSVIVPARNEERSIVRCLESLLKQEYDDYEVVVVDDESSDATSALAASIAAREPRLRVVSGAPLTDDWLGKPHALCQAAAVARGEILILTDADTVHTPDSVSWAVTNLHDHDADMLSGYLHQQYGSFGEAIIVPTMYAMMLLLPVSLLPRTKSPQLAFAIGQYVAIRREALDGVGGFESIKDSLADDMAMAARVKSFGYRGVFLDAAAAASCRLYTGYRSAFNGIRRSVYSAIGGNPLSVAGIALIVVGLIVGPAVSVLASYARHEMPGLPVAAAAILFAVQWGLVVWDRDAPFVAFALYPVVFLNLLVITVASMLGTGFGRGVDWKGRTVRAPRGSGVPCEAPVADSTSRSGKTR